MEIFYTDASTLNNGNFGKQITRICVTDATGKVLVDHIVGDKTNIEGEAYAILSAFKRIQQLKIPHAEVRSDSQFWVKTVNFQWSLKKPRLFPLRDKLQELFRSTGASLLWVPREQNYAGIFLERDMEKSKKKRKAFNCPHCGKPIERGFSGLSDGGNTPAI